MAAGRKKLRWNFLRRGKKQGDTSKATIPCDENGNHLDRAYLESRSSVELEQMMHRFLQSETAREYGETVRNILAILWEREKDIPVEITPETRKTREEYQAGCASDRELERMQKKNKRVFPWKR